MAFFLSALSFNIFLFSINFWLGLTAFFLLLAFMPWGLIGYLANRKIYGRPYFGFIEWVDKEHKFGFITSKEFTDPIFFGFEDILLGQTKDFEMILASVFTIQEVNGKTSSWRSEEMTNVGFQVVNGAKGPRAINVSISRV